MRHSILLFAAAALAVACSDPKYSCTTDGNCPTGTTCDAAQKLCVIAGGCTQICKTNEQCVAAVCVAQSCPVCNANQYCDTTTFKCIAVTDGTISQITPAAGGVIGGASAAVLAHAGAPNGGPLHVDFVLKSSSGATLSSVSVASGDLQGNYTGTLNLAGATTSTGDTLVATVFWHDVQGVVQQKSTGPTTVAIDETPPSINGIATDHAYYSSAANPSGIATVTASIVDTGGSAGVAASSVKLTVGNNPPVAGTLQSGSTTVYQFPVSLSTLGVASGSSGAVSFSIAAADQLNNSGSATGAINVDNIAPTFSAASVPTAWYSGTATIAPAITVNTADTGGSGVDPNTVAVQVDATHGPYKPDTFTSGTASWSMLTGASFQAANTQGAVPFNFIMNDAAGNAATPSAQSINIDRKAPAVSNVTAPTTWVARTGTVTVTAIVDDTGGSGPASAALSVAGQTDVVGTTSGTGASVTYSFSVPATYQTVGSETPLAFTVAGTDAVGNVTAAASAGTGTLLIDDLGPRVSSVTVNGGDATVNSVRWFNQQVATDIDVTAMIVDNGSGVDPLTVRLVLQSNALTRVDYAGSAGGFPKLDATVPNLWHFAVKRSGGPIAAGKEGPVLFQAVAKDKLGHTQQADTAAPNISTASLGIDGQAPTVTLTITAPNVNYPPAGTDCDLSTAADPISCGHDGSHWWRRGLGTSGAELTAMTFTGQELDSNGSGMDPGTGTCSIGGSALTCTPTSGDTLGVKTATYSFKPNFSDAALSGTVDVKTGGQTAAISVAASDAVGNPATLVTATGIQISRLRWVNSLNASATGSPGVTSLQGAPVVTGSPAPQVIVGGSSASNPIVALKPSGGTLWTGGGAAGISPVTGNMAYDWTASMLYAMGGTTFAGLHTTGTASGIDKYCSAGLTSALGSPVIYTAGTSGVVLAADSGSTPPRINAFTPANLSASGGSCSSGIPAAITSTASIGPPTVNGTTIYWGYDNTATTAGDAGVVSATFASGTFSGVTTHKLNSTTPSQNGVPPLVGTYSFIALADSLFLGNSVNRSYYNFSYSYGWNWTTTAFGGSTTLVAPVVVAKGLALGISGGNSGQIYAYYKVSDAAAGTVGGTLKWSYPGSDLGSISSPVTASDGMIYFSDSKNNEFQAIKPATAATTPVMSWNFKGPTGLALTGVSSEATIDAKGIIYFGQSTGNVYALITDVGSSAAAVGTDWPRTGYDNCNSSNTAFSCQ